MRATGALRPLSKTFYAQKAPGLGSAALSRVADAARARRFRRIRLVCISRPPFTGRGTTEHHRTAFNLTQSLRALLAGRGVRVHAALTGPTDTDMTRGFEIPKATPEAVARAIFDAVANGEEDIFPDPMSAAVADGWRSGVAKELERQNLAFVPANA